MIISHIYKIKLCNTQEKFSKSKKREIYSISDQRSCFSVLSRETNFLFARFIIMMIRRRRAIVVVVVVVLQKRGQNKRLCFQHHQRNFKCLYHDSSCSPLRDLNTNTRGREAKEHPKEWLLLWGRPEAQGLLPVCLSFCFKQVVWENNFASLSVSLSPAAAVGCFSLMLEASSA